MRTLRCVAAESSAEVAGENVSRCRRKNTSSATLVIKFAPINNILGFSRGIIEKRLSGTLGVYAKRACLARAAKRKRRGQKESPRDEARAKIIRVRLCGGAVEAEAIFGSDTH